jgi:hypothetical protein
VPVGAGDAVGAAVGAGAWVGAAVGGAAAPQAETNASASAGTIRERLLRLLSDMTGTSFVGLVPI